MSHGQSRKSLIWPVKTYPKPRLDLNTEKCKWRDDDGGYVSQRGDDYHDDEQDADHDQGQEGGQDREFVVPDVAHGMECIRPCAQGQHDDPESDVVSDPFIEEAFWAHAQPSFHRGHEVLMGLSFFRDLMEPPTLWRGVKAHRAHGWLPHRADALFPGSAQRTDVEDQDEAAQEVHGPVYFIVFGGQNGGGTNEENAQGGPSAQEEADEVSVKGGFVRICSAFGNDVPHAEPCYQCEEQYQDGSYGQVHGSVIAGSAGEPLGKGLWKRSRCRRDRALGAMLSYGRLRVCRHVAGRMAAADRWLADTRRVGLCSCRRSGAVLLLSAVMRNLGPLFQNASP